MAILSTLERKFGKYFPENPTKILLIGQVLSYVMVYSRPDLASYFHLTGAELLHGQVWRLFTILFAPVSSSLIFVIFAWYFFYLFATALENEWGAFRYIIYISIAYLGTIVAALLFPDIQVSNAFIYVSLFLAFTYLYPEFQLLLFFIIPVRVKWLGYLLWLGLIASFIFGTLETKVLTLLSISNFFLFFHDDLRYTARTVYRGSASKSKIKLHKAIPFHVCGVCGKNEIDNPDMDIRYCNECTPTTCYCREHIGNHQHKRVVN